jgi:mannan endo-1,4-beta-mannosidase
VVAIAVAEATTLTVTAAARVAPASAISNSPIIQASGTQLYLYGAPYHFVGVNAYEAATMWGTNAGCGADLSDAQLDQLFSSLPPNSLVRFWAFQGSTATDVNTHQLDWGPLDRVFAAAAAHNQRLIVVLTDQGGTCDGGHWQDPSWYAGGFQGVFNDPTTTDGRGLTPLSYWAYLQAIVSRYATSPALGMWEPISEAEASTCAPQYQPNGCSGHQTCPDEPAAASDLRHFFDIVGGEIHALDPKHLVESGFLGGGQCGTQGSDYQYVSASPGIDVLSYHDYWGPDPVGGDQWNGMQVRFRQSVGVGKPIIAGEAGLKAGSIAGCMSLVSRNRDLSAKVRAQVRAGSSGLLVWNWVPQATTSCSYEVGPLDPVLRSRGAIR